MRHLSKGPFLVGKIPAGHRQLLNTNPGRLLRLADPGRSFGWKTVTVTERKEFSVDMKTGETPLKEDE
jgi:hypothetical protein